MDERHWWGGAVLGLAGDVVTTWYGIEVLNISEKNAIAQHVFDVLGVVPGLVATKLAVLFVCIALYHSVDEHAWLLPAIVATIYVFVTVVNAGVILTA